MIDPVHAHNKEFGASRGDVVWSVSSDEVAQRLGLPGNPDGTFRSERELEVARLRRTQRICRIPGTKELCNKVPFARVLNAAREAADDPGAFAFWPESWVIPEQEDDIEELAKWRAHKRERKNKRDAPVFIYKPNGGNQARFPSDRKEDQRGLHLPKLLCDRCDRCD